MFDRNANSIIEAQLHKNPFLPVYSVVADFIRDEISCNHLHPGERLKEIDTAESLGVSRSTVRKAFDLLVLEGIALRRKNGRVEISPMLRRSYREIVEIRCMLDSYASRLAALRRTNEDLRKMKEAIDRVLEENIDLKTEADLEFHKTIYMAARNSYILRIYDELSVELIRSRYLSASGVKEPGMRRRVYEEHTRIYEAILMQDSHLAALEAEQHAKILLEPLLISASGLVDTFQNR